MCERDPEPIPDPNSGSGSSSSGSGAGVSPCPQGWALYSDPDGLEGHQSCVAVFAFENPSVFDDAATLCPTHGPGAHLLTALSYQPTSPNGTILELANTLVGQSDMYYIGCRHHAGVADHKFGWMWVDNTDADNLNCYGNQGPPMGPPRDRRMAENATTARRLEDPPPPCGLWDVNQPDPQ